MPRASLGAAEQLEAALEVLERELEVALAAPHAAHLVDDDGAADDGDREHDQAEHEAEAEAADELLAPCLLEHGAAALDRLDRADLLDDEHRDDEERRHAPREPEDPKNDRTEDPGALGDPAQDHPDGRGDDGVAHDRWKSGRRDPDAVADGWIPAAEADHRRADEGRVEEERHRVRDDVEHETQRDPGGAQLAGIEIGDADQGQRHGKADQHCHQGDERDQREDDELLSARSTR